MIALSTAKVVMDKWKHPTARHYKKPKIWMAIPIGAESHNVHDRLYDLHFIPFYTSGLGICSIGNSCWYYVHTLQFQPEEYPFCNMR